MKQNYQFTPIGYVHALKDGFCLQLEPGYIPALAGLEGFSHLNILWWANLLDNEEARLIRTCEQPYKNAPVEMGIFATRSPVRPNPICLSVVYVLQIAYEDGKIFIPDIDAEDGTPLIDIKPYHPCTDRLRDVAVPPWCQDWPQWLEDSAAFDWASVFENAG